MKQPAIERIKDLVNKVEVVCVLGLLLLGKHRRRAQKIFAELNLIPGLSNLFDNFIWKLQGLVLTCGHTRVKAASHISIFAVEASIYPHLI